MKLRKKEKIRKEEEERNKKGNLYDWYTSIVWFKKEKKSMDIDTERMKTERKKERHAAQWSERP